MRDAEIMALIARDHEFRVRFGARKMWLHLRAQSHEVARCTVKRLMADHGWSVALRGNWARVPGHPDARTGENSAMLCSQPCVGASRSFVSCASRAGWMVADVDVTGPRARDGWTGRNRVRQRGRAGVSGWSGRPVRFRSHPPRRST